ncbi:hypothetical protein R4Z09_26075 [Niallia oryzisoli]|uniref:Uncharacterized protein n=1 Tax=Niallia oryzisoli TaxID=1737571 RepID=A0ABZ2CC07_9BACI
MHPMQPQPNMMYDERDHHHHHDHHHGHHHHDHHHHHEKCKKHLYQFIQIELKDGSVYQGILHSYDKDKIYLIMPSVTQTNVTIHSEDESRQFFPFFGPFGLFGFPFFGVRRFGPFFPFFI